MTLASDSLVSDGLSLRAVSAISGIYYTPYLYYIKLFVVLPEMDFRRQLQAVAGYSDSTLAVH